MASLRRRKSGRPKEAVVAVLQNILDKGVDAKEVDKVKQQTAAARVFGNQTAEQQAERNGDDYSGDGDD